MRLGLTPRPKRVSSRRRSVEAGQARLSGRHESGVFRLAVSEPERVGTTHLYKPGARDLETGFAHTTSRHEMPTVKPPLARRPATCPSGQAGGKAGNRSTVPAWLWSSISPTAAAAPKLASIWNRPGSWEAKKIVGQGPFEEFLQALPGKAPFRESCP